ncbi:MAG: YceI family protein [Bacteriovoracaceae bacterium]
MHFIICLIFVSTFAFASEYTLSMGKANYTVKHLIKKVSGETTELKGKMICENSLCKFLVAAPVVSFVSSDSNRDLNMQTIMEASKFPLVSIKGEFQETDLNKKQFNVNGKVNLHGVEKTYTLNLTQDGVFQGKFVLLLEDHKIERPSLLTVKIDNEVPIDFVVGWKK